MVSYFILFYFSFCRYGAGFIFWNLDNLYCENITILREKALRPSNTLRYLTPFTQLHGWWHLFAGYATYLQILACIQQRLHFLRIEYFIRPSLIGIVVKISPVQRLKMLKSKHYQE